MPEGILDATDTPVAVTLAGREYLLPVLKIDDLMAVGRLIQERAKQRVLKRLPLTATPARRQEIHDIFDARETSVQEIAQYTQTPTGSREFIKRSLARADVKGADADAWVRRYADDEGMLAAADLAARVSGLYPKPKDEPKADEPGEGGDPNSVGAETPPATETTDATASTSNA